MSDERLYKKTIVSVKDATGAYVKQERLVPVDPPAPALPKVEPWVEPSLSELSLDDLLGRCLRTLWREVHNLEVSSHGGQKLTRDQASELRENTKLLMDLKKREKDLLDGLNDEELEALARKKKNDLAGSSGARPRPPRKKKKGSEEI